MKLEEMTVETEIVNLGATIMKTKTPKHIHDRLLIETKQKLESYNHNLAGHLNNQLAFDKEIMMWFYSEMLPIWNAYRQIHCNFHDLEHKPIDFSSSSLWVNHMKAGEFNPLHTHHGDLTFVAYLDVPKEIEEEQKNYVGKSAPPGCIEFMLTFHDFTNKPWATLGKHLTPKTGDLFVFPAKLQHTVPPFKSDVTRISVSGNLDIVNRDNLGEHYF